MIDFGQNNALYGHMGRPREYEDVSYTFSVNYIQTQPNIDSEITQENILLFWA